MPLDQRVVKRKAFSDPDICKHALAGLCPFGEAPGVLLRVRPPLQAAASAAGEERRGGGCHRLSCQKLLLLLSWSRLVTLLLVLCPPPCRPVCQHAQRHGTM